MLVLTLMVLVLASTLLVGFGRAAVIHAVQARQSVLDLQRRWGTTSLRQAILPSAERILAEVEARRHGPVVATSAHVTLGGQNFTIVVGDEDAKVNVNALLQTADADEVTSRLQEAFGGYGLLQNIRLRPAGDRSGAATPGSTGIENAELTSGGAWRPIVGLGQVIGGISPEQWLSEPPGGGLPPSSVLTCYGSGRLNISRASERAVSLFAVPPLTNVEIGRLLEARLAFFQPAGTNALRPTGSRRQEGPINQSRSRRLLEQAGLTLVGSRILPSFADGSSCHSLWVVCDDGRRRWYSLAVVDRTDADRPVWSVQDW